MVVILALTVTAVVVAIGTPLGIAGYYEHQRHQEPVGYDSNWFRD